MKINKPRPLFLVLVAFLAFCIPVAPVMAAVGLTIGSGSEVDLGIAGSMDLDCDDVVVNGTLTMADGVLTDVGSLTINPGGVVNLDTGVIHMTQDWNNTGGTVNPGTDSLVIWDSTCGTPAIAINGDSTFHDLTIQTTGGRALTFEKGKTTTVDGHLLLGGVYPGGLLVIRSSEDGTQSFLEVNGSFNVTGVDVKDNNAKLPGAWIDFGPPLAFNSIDSGNNYRWFRSGPGIATPFIIKKIWDQGGDQDALDAIEVKGHLSCTGATSTQQNVVFTATTDAIVFVYELWQIPDDAQVDCTVTEEVPAGYTASYSCDEDNCGDSGQDVDACFWGNVDRNIDHVCTITNTPDPATITVTKTWIIEGADQGFDGGFWLGAFCDSPVRGPQPNYGCPDGCFAQVREEEAAAKPTDYEFTILKPNYPFTQCEIREQPDDNVVEIENGCGEMRLSAGEDVKCEVVNTVFFEGIPTLNQYGMAVLALLMLGVGFVGFRRWV